MWLILNQFITNYWQALIPLIISIIAICISLVSYHRTKRVAIKEATDVIFKDWYSKELQKLRGYFFYDFVPNHRAKLVGKGVKDIERVVREDKGRAKTLCFFFDKVGWLGAADLINVDYVLGPMQHTMRRTWIVMEPLIAKEREPKADKMFDPVFQYGFEWLFRRSCQHSKHQAKLLMYRFLRPHIRTRVEIRKLKVQIDIDEANFRRELEEKY